ncbi:MAG: 2-isopropylmalate synthase [Oscillospiraceae bacterium]|nr:2-isopropylmalate synthase [Oscillospiraceae bacterium]
MIKDADKKYGPAQLFPIEGRTWPDRKVSSAPVWCSVDLRDGDQALVTPMGLDDKLAFFDLLCRIGFTQIEVGSPASSEAEFEFVRALIEGGSIPDGVTVQVITPANGGDIEKTFEAIRGAKRAAVHLFSNISPLHRKIVFETGFKGAKDMAVSSAELMAELAAGMPGTDISFEYSPEGFCAAPVEETAEICAAVMKALGASPERKVVIDLPSTVECLPPNVYADAVELFCRSLPDRDSAVISVHPHNDRGTAVACAELALCAGAERVEGTLFGNGERTGNVDIVTLALNLLSEGIDPMLDLSDLPGIKRFYESRTRMHVPERQPYSGLYAFTALSGSHEDAILKGLRWREEHGEERWDIPYLPIDPTDVGRRYDDLVRINSQSGRNGAAFILETQFGFTLPRAMRPEFGELVRKKADRSGAELDSQAVYDLFEETYIKINSPYRLASYSFDDKAVNAGGSQVCFSGKLYYNDIEYDISGSGNGPIDAFFNAISDLTISRYHFVSYSEHAVSSGSDSRAAAYIQLETPDGGSVFGVGLSHNIYLASIRGIISAINRGVALRSVAQAPRRTF